MLEKLLNQKVIVLYTGYNHMATSIKGIVTSVDKDFIELDNEKLIAIKYLVTIEKK